jgi:hypothetical protein
LARRLLSQGWRRSAPARQDGGRKPRSAGAHERYRWCARSRRRVARASRIPLDPDCTTRSHLLVRSPERSTCSRAQSSTPPAEQLRARGPDLRGPSTRGLGDRPACCEGRLPSSAETMRAQRFGELAHRQARGAVFLPHDASRALARRFQPQTVPTPVAAALVNKPSACCRRCRPKRPCGHRSLGTPERPESPL